MKAIARYVLVQLVVVTLAVAVVMRAAGWPQFQLAKPALGAARGAALS